MQQVQRAGTIAGFRGEQLLAGDVGYDERRRIFNGMFDRRPALIARCTGTADVVAAVDHAREQRLPLAVHGGGHGVTGHAVCDGGVMIDLRAMQGVHVDPVARIARVQGGATWGQVDRETQLHALAVTGGRASTTGVAGLTLGSGSGWLERKLGFTCDNLLSAEVVTADGRVVTASETEHPDLFWGLRGGGGNFGIVTSFVFRLHPIGPLLLGGMLMHPHGRAHEVMAFYRDFMAGAPDEVGGAISLMSAPPEPFVPEPVRGRPVLGLIVTYAGAVDEGREVLRPLLEFGPPAVQMVDVMPYTAIQQLIDPGNPHGMRNYWSADFLTGLPATAIDALADYTARVPSPNTHVIVIPGGGAVARVDDDATAFGDRSAPWNIHILGMWADAADDERQIAWVRELTAAMAPYRTGHAYLNFLGEEGEERVRAAFGAEKHDRLVAIKDRWDPDNLFRLNQNIKPSGSRVTA